MILGDFINNLAKTSGLKEDDENLVALLATEAAKVEIKDEFATSLQSGLLTLDAAKQNPDLKKYYSAQILDSMDKEIVSAAEALKLDEPTMQRLASEQSTYKKVGLLANLVKELEPPEPTDPPKDDASKKALEATISQLNGEISTLKDESVGKEKHDQLVGEKDKQIDLLYQDKLYSGFRWANSNLPATANITTANALVTAEMAEKDLSWKRENGSLRLVTAEDQDYYLDNKKVTGPDFIQEIAARYDLLENSPPDTPPTPGLAPPVDTGQVLPEAKEAYDEAIKNAESVSKAIQDVPV